MYLYMYANVDRTTGGQQASTPTEAGFSLSQSCASSVCARCVGGGRLPIVGRAPGRSMVHPALIAAFHTVIRAVHNVIICVSTHASSRFYPRQPVVAGFSHSPRYSQCWVVPRIWVGDTLPVVDYHQFSLLAISRFGPFGPETEKRTKSVSPAVSMHTH